MKTETDNLDDAAPGAGPLRVLVVDDHELVRQGFADLIEREEGMHVVAQAADGREALRLTAEHHPDVALIDFSLPDMNGLDLIRAMRRAAPGVRMLVVSMHEESAYAESVVRAGAMGYVNKEDSIVALPGAIRRVARGEFHLSPRLARQFPHHGGDPDASGRP